MEHETTENVKPEWEKENKEMENRQKVKGKR